MQPQKFRFPGIGPRDRVDRVDMSSEEISLYNTSDAVDLSYPPTTEVAVT